VRTPVLQLVSRDEHADQWADRVHQVLSSLTTSQA
jgi:hypothetical protein